MPNGPPAGSWIAASGLLMLGWLSRQAS